MEDLKRTVAKNITALRVASKMTQLELGNKISYSDKAVSKWERAEAIPDIYVLMKISDLFGVTVDYLLVSHDESETKSATKRKKPPVNHNVIILLALVGVFTVVTLTYVVLHLSGTKYPLIYQYGINICAVLLVVFNSMWGKRKYSFISISVLVNSLILTVYLIFLSLSHNYWELLLLCIPAETIVVLSFMVRRNRKKPSESEKTSKTE